MKRKAYVLAALTGTLLAGCGSDGGKSSEASAGSGGTAGEAGSGGNAGQAGSGANGGSSGSSSAGGSSSVGGTAGTAGLGGTAGVGGSAGASGGSAGTGGAPGSAGAGGAAGVGGTGGTGGTGVVPSCEIPDAQVLDVIHSGATLTFSTTGGDTIEIGTTSDTGADQPDSWNAGPTLNLSAAGVIKVFARVVGSSCEAGVFEHVYQVEDSFAPAAGEVGTTALGWDDSSIDAWASGYVSPVSYGTDVDVQWQTPDKALGEGTTDSTDIVVLGNGGEIVMTFASPIRNGPGPDLAVFENGFNDTYLELAFVEVSSDGVNFVRFDSVYLNTMPVAGYGAHDPVDMTGLAGKYAGGFGTPFDLDQLRYRPLVQSGVVDLSAITHVRIVDIIGDGSVFDSFGNPIYDPTPTMGSGGFDLEAIAVLNVGN